MAIRMVLFEKNDVLMIWSVKYTVIAALWKVYRRKFISKDMRCFDFCKKTASLMNSVRFRQVVFLCRLCWMTESELVFPLYTR